MPKDSTFFWFDMFYNSPSCDPAALIYSSSFWSGSAGQVPAQNPGGPSSQCQYAEVPSYYGSYQYWQGDGHARAKVVTSSFAGGQYSMQWFQELDWTCTGNTYTSQPWVARQDGSCLVQSRDSSYSGRARVPAPFSTANSWPTPTPSSTPSASPDLSAFGRLAAPSSSSSAPDNTGGIVGGIVGAVVVAVGAFAAVRYFQRQKQLEAKRAELERQAKEGAVGGSVNPIALDIKKQFAPSSKPGRK
jgi:hypothetical protein